MSRRNQNYHQRPREDLSSSLRAEVAAIKGGLGGRFVVAYPLSPISPRLTEETSITFSLPSAWTGGREPEKGQVVDLYEVTLFQAGWRAQRASPVVAT